MDNEVSVKALSEEELHKIELYVNDKFRNGAGFNCSQVVSSYFAEQCGIDGDIIKKISCGFGGGMRKGEVCGAVTGGIMTVGMKYGACNINDADGKASCYSKTVQFEDAFMEKEGSVLCRDLLKCDISTPEGYSFAKENGLFPKICPKMILTAIATLKELGY